METGKINFKQFIYLCLGLFLIVVLLLILKFVFSSTKIDTPFIQNYSKPVEIKWDLFRKPLSITLPVLDIALTPVPQATTSGAYVSLTAEVKGVSQGPFIYRFDCSGDGVFELETEATFQKMYTANNLCLFNEEGTFVSKVVVEGLFDYFQDGQQIQEQKTSQVSSVVKISDSNLAPVFSACDVDSIEGTTQVNFKFNFTSEASDPNGDEIKYEWDFGDGNKAEGQNVEYNYKTVGFYIPKAKVTDTKGAFSYCIASSLTILKGLSYFEIIKVPQRIGRENPFAEVTADELILEIPEIKSPATTTPVTNTSVTTTPATTTP